MDEYRQIGTVMFVAKDEPGAMAVSSCITGVEDPGAECHEQLRKMPDPAGFFVVECHMGWEAYPQVTEQLATRPEVKTSSDACSCCNCLAAIYRRDAVRVQGMPNVSHVYHGLVYLLRH